MARIKERLGVYVASERQLEISGDWRRARGQVPIIWVRGFFGNGWTLQRGAGAVSGEVYGRPFRLIADRLGLVVASADFAGGSLATTWAVDTVVGTGGRIDALITWMGTNLGTRTDRVIIMGDSMGSLEALNWAWRNHTRVVAIYVRAPIVRFQGFWDANPTFQGIIDTAWGNHATWLAGLPTHDPAQNMAALSILGPKTFLQYTGQDELIPPTWIVDYAATTGARLNYGHGNHEANVFADGAPVAEWLADRIKSAA